jgi:hypothetical protein
MPGPTPGFRGGTSNLKSKHLIYIRSDEVFRYIASHPFT